MPLTKRPSFFSFKSDSSAPTIVPSSADRSPLETPDTTDTPTASTVSAAAASPTTLHPTVPLPSTFTDGLPLPRLLVFDLDYTLWPFWSDTHVSPPLKPHSAGRAVRDVHGETFKFYDDVPGILAACRAHGLMVAAASRTGAVDVASEMLRLLMVSPAGHGDGGARGRKKEPECRPAEKFFDSVQIFPGNKAAHLAKIREATRVPYEDMVFWDDELRNGNVEKEKGVCFWLVRDGLTRGEVDKGVEKWRKVRAADVER